jgi:hypothetical protein
MRSSLVLLAALAGKDMSHVNSDVAKELTEESQCTALNSHIGRVGESRVQKS